MATQGDVGVAPADRVRDGGDVERSLSDLARVPRRTLEALVASPTWPRWLLSVPRHGGATATSFGLNLNGALTTTRMGLGGGE